jgi:hypothetical protein
MPAPKMFEVPGTSSLTTDPQGLTGSATAFVLIVGAVEGGTWWSLLPVQPTVRRHAIATAASGRWTLEYPP